MDYIFNLILILFFIVLKTVILPNFFCFHNFYDIMLIAVIYISYDYSNAKSLFFLTFIAILVEAISIAPFGIYLTTYFWVFVFINSFRRILEKKVTVILIFLISIIFENLIFAFVFKVIYPERVVWDFIYAGILKQLLWGVVTSYFMFSFIYVLKERTDKLFFYIRRNVLFKS